MQPLTSSDFRSILKLLEQLYVPQTLETFSTAVLSLLATVVPCDLSAEGTIDFEQRKVSLVGLPLAAHDIEQLSHQHFDEHPSATHPNWRIPGRVHTLSDFLTTPQLHRLEGLYQQLMRPLGLEEQIGFGLVLSSPRPVGFVLFRDRRSFSERERGLLEVLHPHLLQAYTNAQALTQRQAEMAQLKQSLDQTSLIILTSAGQVQVMTRRAEALLLKYFQPLGESGYHLPDTLQRWVNYQLSSTAKLASSRSPLRVEHAGQALTIRLFCDHLGENSWLLLVEEVPTPLSADLFEGLGLSPREAEVLFWLVQNKCPQEIATRLSCRCGTVKKHLEHIYKKLGVQTRLAAVTQALKQIGQLQA